MVFNYGLFDFDTPHFIWRFCLGQTDYIVGAEMYDSFKKEYMERGSSITEQELALTPQETDRLWNLLALNCRPENRTYRYNFFYNNCSTKARDIIYQSLNQPVSVARTDSVSLRTVLHTYNSAYPWASFGIDLLLGTEGNLGICTEALRLLIDYCFNVKGFDTLWCDFFVDNPASGRVMEKCGFRDTGKVNYCSQLQVGSDRPVRIMRLDRENR